MDKYDFLRQFISPFIKGENAEALIRTLADEAQKLEDLSVAVNDQLTISTATGDGLDKRLAEIGITRPPELGMDDLAFRKMGIQINAQKQIIEVIHTILSTFFGDDTTRAWTQCTQAETYALQDGDELILEFESGDPLTIVFKQEDFRNIQLATAQEIADIISRYLRSIEHNGYASAILDAETQQYFVRIYGGAKGPYSMVRVLGGRVQSVLEFPTMRGTELPSNTTIWQITRTIGSTIRFRWYAGPQPLLDKVLPGDKALIYGAAFENYSLSGSYTVANVSPPQSVPTYESGWFEVENPMVSELKSTPPGVAPSPNNPPAEIYSYLVGQVYYSDLKFFLPKKNTPYSLMRYALAFEPAKSLLKIYMPATTMVVRRDLIGSCHLHLNYDKGNLDGSFGSLVDEAEMVEVVSDRAIRYKQSGADNTGTGGALFFDTAPPSGVAIKYVSRENGWATVVCEDPHGIKGFREWLNSSDYLADAEVVYQGSKWKAVDASGPSWGGAIEPSHGSTAKWRWLGGATNPSDKIVTVQVSSVPEDDQLNPFLGTYLVDPEANYTLTNQVLTTREKLVSGQKVNTLFCRGAVSSQSGIAIFDLGKDTQEGPVQFFGVQTVNAPKTSPLLTLSQNGVIVTAVCTEPHGAIPGSTVVVSGITTVPTLNGTFTVLSVPSPTTYVAQSPMSQIASVSGEGQSLTAVDGSACTMLIDPGYSFKYTHEIGSDISVLSSAEAFQPDADGSDYGTYITGTTEGRIFCEELLRQITAAGINLEVTVVYPSDIGLGNEGGSADVTDPPASDKIWVWGL